MPLPLEDYALLGDTQTAALVGIDGSIDWMCAPRFDSGAFFAALLGNEMNGRWRIGAKGAARAAGRGYIDGTLVLETEWRTPTGVARVTDFMPPRTAHPDLVRLVHGIEGRVEMEMDLVVRFDYGRLVPWARRVGGDMRYVSGPDSIVLRTDQDVHGELAPAGGHLDVLHFENGAAVRILDLRRRLHVLDGSGGRPRSSC